MSNFSKLWKKATAGILVAAMIVGMVPTSDSSVQAAASTAFDEENIVLKFGVLSDLHLLQSDTENVTTVQGRIQKYANAVATLDQLAGNDLDMLMLAGDYTNQGTETQATTFASATKAILDAVNTDKADGNKTQLIMTYGNHDTYWTNYSMDCAGWETVLNNYNLLDNVTKCEAAPGCYKAATERNGKTYYFYSLETESYNNPSNMFYQEALDWLDEELKTVTTKNPNAYVYVVSHAPIAESGVYGADITFEKNADWATANAGSEGTADDGSATSGNIDVVLSKYPQVVYFSGHTHLTNALESTIMQDDYTAVAVSGFNRGDLYSSETTYLDGSAHPSGVDSSAYGLYVAVDKNGNQRIERVKMTSNNMVTTTVTYGSDYVVDTVSIPESDATIETLEKVWDMAYPSDDKSHLTAYTSERGAAPTFADGAAVTVENLAFGDNKESVSFDVSFDTATCTNKIIRYELQLVNQNGKVVDNSWILGNWTNHTTGIVNEGETHLNATKLKYSVSYTSEQLAGSTEITAEIYAVDEFGVKSEALTSAKQALGILKPSAAGANYNMFDGFTADRIIVASSANSAIKDTMLISKTDEIGKLSVAVDTVTAKANGGQSNEEIAYAMNKYRYDYMNAIGESVKTGWSNTATNAKKYSELKVEDTFVYEADYSIEALGHGVYVTFRTTDAVTYQTDYTGFFINYTQCGLYINGVIANSSTAFKYTGDNRADSNTWHLTIVSSSEKVSMWINDTLVFDNVDFTVKSYATENTGSDSATYPYLHENACNGSTVKLKSTDMIPVIGQYAVGGEGQKYTLSNQMLYLYNVDEQAEDLVGADERNYYDASKVTTNNTANSFSKTANSLEVDVVYDTTNSVDKTDRIYANLSSDEFSVNDTVIMEFDYTPTQLDNGDNREIQVHFRNGSKKIGILMRDGTTQPLFSEQAQGELFEHKYDMVSEGHTLHFKVVSEPTKASIYINGVTILTDYSYGDDATSMMPYLEFFVRNGYYEIENISIRKGAGTLEDVTPLTSEKNLLEGEYGEIVSNIMTHNTLAGISDSVVNDKTNFYTDMTWMNLKENGASSYYDLAETFRFFGKNNTNYRMKSGESYVMSSLVRAGNGTLTGDDEKKHLSRINVSVASYDGVEAWYFIEDTMLNVMNVGSDAHAVRLNLANEIGYQVGDYIRLTTAVSPYGYDIYIDGLKIYTYVAENNTYIDYSVAYIGGKGAEVRFIDTAVWYNTANGELYKEKLLEEARTYETLSGVYFENKTMADAIVQDIQTACNSLSDTSNETLQQYVSVIDRLIASGIVVNNMVYDGTASIAKSFDVDMDGDENDSWEFKTFSAFTDSSFSTSDSWILEADVTCLANWAGQARVGLIFQASGEPDVMILDKYAFYCGSGHTKEGTEGPVWKAGQSWRVRYVVNPTDGIQTVITDISTGTQIYDYTVGWDKLRTYTSLVPYLYLACGDYEVRNVYVGYDLTDDIAELSKAITESADKNAGDYTIASFEVYEKALDAANVVHNCTAAYTKDEINTATTNLLNAVNALSEGDIISVGTENIGVASVRVDAGDVLPTGIYVDDKYIISWNDAEGNALTQYTGGELTNYVADYVDTSMLQVGTQDKPGNTDSVLDVRFIGSVDDLDRYKTVGFVVSLSNTEPVVGGSKCVQYGDLTNVYENILADGVSTNVKTIYSQISPDSTHMFAHKIKNIPIDSETNMSRMLHVRAYVELLDGTIVYGNTSHVSIDVSQ